MPAGENEIKEKYLERAISELNLLAGELKSCGDCARTGVMPVLGSGHPQADIMLLKQRPVTSEVEEGVAFYGRAGNALMKSFKRLGIDPMTVYGTIGSKCPGSDQSGPADGCSSRVRDEFTIVQPRILVVMGEDALELVNGLEIPLGRILEVREGEVQAFTPSCDVLLVPDIDDCLDEDGAKRRFWRAFRTLGDWHRDLPPW